MGIKTSYPGVYIDEFTPAAPIQGVGTSTAAFIGPATNGPLNTPVKVTSWDQFVSIFGASPPSGYYMWYAVRGFYQNGGTVCYTTRVSNASHAYLDLLDENEKPTIRVWAREVGASHGIKLKTTPEVAMVTTKLFKTEATIQVATSGEDMITVSNAADAANFQPEDKIAIEDSTDNYIITRVEGATLRLSRALSSSYATDKKVRLANLVSGDAFLRVEDGAKLCPGSVISLSQGSTTEFCRVKSVRPERLSETVTTFRVELSQGIANTYDFSVADAIDVISHEFKLSVDANGIKKEYDMLGMDPEHSNYYRKLINENPGDIYVTPVDPPNLSASPKNRPKKITQYKSLDNGIDEDNSLLSPNHYQDALKELEVIDDVNIICIPDRTDKTVQLAMIGHCEKMKDRFAILDAKRAAPLFGTDSVDEQRNGIDSTRGYAALYYPWLKVPSSKGKEQVIVPPSGFVAGVYARIDNNRGVHKAPAGTKATINGALDVETKMSDIDQGELNKKGINAIRIFKSGGRPIVWGSKTTATDSNWMYVNTRRLFIFLEESIEENMRDVVFEPNNPELWQLLTMSISSFLTDQWENGALFGKTAEESFYVRIDDTLNPFSEQQLGRLNVEIGIRVAYPTEFIIIQIGIWDGGSEVSEN